MPERSNRQFTDLRNAGLALLAYGLVTALIGFVGAGWDTEVRDWLFRNCPIWLTQASGYLARLGQGGPLTALVLVIALVQTYRSRSVRPLLTWLSAFILLYGIVGMSKVYLRRGAPRDPDPVAVDFFSKPFCGGPECQSYPSGHVANAIVWYGVAFLLAQNVLSATWQAYIKAVVVAVVSVATVVAGHHWLTDSVAGVFAGIAVYHLTRCYWMRFGQRRGERPGAKPYDRVMQ
jgi:membrane-associated phospholipid phosphatase